MLGQHLVGAPRRVGAHRDAWKRFADLESESFDKDGIVPGLVHAFTRPAEGTCQQKAAQVRRVSPAFSDPGPLHRPGRSKGIREQQRSVELALREDRDFAASIRNHYHRVGSSRRVLLEHGGNRRDRRNRQVRRRQRSPNRRQCRQCHHRIAQPVRRPHDQSIKVLQGLIASYWVLPGSLRRRPRRRHFRPTQRETCP